MLLAHVVARPRTWLLAHGDHALEPAQAAQWRALLDRRAGGEPLAYLVGMKEFRGLAFEVTPDVLVPRPETELLVDWSLALLADAPPARDVVDLGTGSGAIAVAVAVADAVRAAGHRVAASDASERALAVARRNAARHRADIAFAAGDWWAPFAGRAFDLAVANPPYVAAADAHLAALAAEPAHALVAGADGLDDLRRIVAVAPAHLKPGGWLLLEHGHDQGAAVRALLTAAAFEAVETRRDLAGRARATGGRLVKRRTPERKLRVDHDLRHPRNGGSP